MRKQIAWGNKYKQEGNGKSKEGEITSNLGSQEYFMEDMINLSLACLPAFLLS